MRFDTLEAVALVVFAASLFVIAAASIHFGPRIAVQDIPMQWGTDGRPTWYAPRIIGLWWMLYLAVAVGGGLLALAHVATGPATGKMWLASMALSVIMAGVQVWHLNAVTRWAAGP
jgi:hypothetical protein